MKVKDLMTTDVKSCTPDTTVAEAAHHSREIIRTACDAPARASRFADDRGGLRRGIGLALRQSED